MHIIEADGIWITAIVENRWVQAKVYQIPSNYGVNEGMVSKICIGKSAARDPNGNFFNQMAYNYDRGLDFDDLNNDGMLNSIIEQLENYRKKHPYMVD